MRFFTVLHLACLLASSVCASAQDTEPTHWIEVYDLRSLTASALESGGGVNMIPSGKFAIGGMEPVHLDIGIEDPAWTLSDFELESLARAFIDVCPFPEEATIRVSAGFLTLDGSVAQHERTEQWTRALYDQLHRTASYELYRLERVPSDWTSVVTAQQVQAWLTSSGTVPDFEVRCPLGKRALLGARASKAILSDYDTEKAQYQVVVDPWILPIIDGIDLGAIAVETSDGRLFVRQWGLASYQVHEPRRFHLLETEPHVLMLPTVEDVQWTSSGILEDGGGMVIAHDAMAGGTRLLVLRKDEEPANDLGFIPVGVLTAAPLVSWPWLTRDVLPSGGMSPRDPGLEFSEQAALQQVDLIWGLGDATREAGVEIAWRIVNNAAFPMATANSLGAAREFVAEWEERVARTISIEVRYGYVDPQDWREQRAESARAQDWLHLLDHRILTQARNGDSTYVRGILSTWYLHDYDVDVGNSGIYPAAPYVSDSETGMKFWCCPQLAPGGTIQAWTHLGVAAEVAPLEVYEAHFPYAPAEKASPLFRSGRIELPHVEIVNEVQNAIHESGEWSPLVVSRMDALDRVLVAVVRMTVD
tara:strand:- start:22570 stop:24336 length:1767 start_codon:yes stop_codon:yes gene_type:complete